MNKLYRKRKTKVDNRVNLYLSESSFKFRFKHSYSKEKGSFEGAFCGVGDGCQEIGTSCGLGNNCSVGGGC